MTSTYIGSLHPLYEDLKNDPTRELFPLHLGRKSPEEKQWRIHLLRTLRCNLPTIVEVSDYPYLCTWSRAEASANSTPSSVLT